MFNTKNDVILSKELGRRRVYLFFAVFLLIVFGLTIFEESDKIFNAMDDFVITGIAIIMLAYIGIVRKKDSINDLKNQNSVFMVLFIIALIFKLIAVGIEFSDPADFGNEIPAIIILLVGIANKFL